MSTRDLMLVVLGGLAVCAGLVTLAFPRAFSSAARTWLTLKDELGDPSPREVERRSRRTQVTAVALLACGGVFILKVALAR